VSFFIFFFFPPKKKPPPHPPKKKLPQNKNPSPKVGFIFPSWQDMSFLHQDESVINWIPSRIELSPCGRSFLKGPVRLFPCRGWKLRTLMIQAASFRFRQASFFSSSRKLLVLYSECDGESLYPPPLKESPPFSARSTRLPFSVTEWRIGFYRWTSRVSSLSPSSGRASLLFFQPHR